MGLADRDYMRDEEPRRHWSASALLMMVIGAAFVVQQAAVIYIRQNINVPTHQADALQVDHALSLLALNADGLRHGYLWQLLTFQFLHMGFWHLAGNLLGIWFFGRFIEYRLDNASFLKIYFISGLAGGLLQGLLGLVFENRFGGTVVGASAGVVGLLAAFAMLEPDAQILLWFLLPIKARHFLYFSVGIAAFFVVVPTETAVAHGAHLGGLLAGAALIRWQLYNWMPGINWQSHLAPKRLREFVKTASDSGNFWPRAAEAKEPENAGPEEFISREVDPILDKISAHGIQSLTDRERQILDAARKKMAQR